MIKLFNSIPFVLRRKNFMSTFLIFRLLKLLNLNTEVSECVRSSLLLAKTAKWIYLHGLIELKVWDRIFFSTDIYRNKRHQNRCFYANLVNISFFFYQNREF